MNKPLQACLLVTLTFHSDLQAILTSSGEKRLSSIKSFGDTLCTVVFIAIKADKITSLINKVNQQMVRYFSQPLENKMKDDHHNHYQTGYWPFGLETAAGAKQSDNKETYFSTDRMV